MIAPLLTVHFVFVESTGVLPSGFYPCSSIQNGSARFPEEHGSR